MSSTSRATLAHIADAAGVSLATISKVLNGRTDVAPGTRKRVEELLTAHNYRKRAGGHSHAPLIELVFHELHSTWSMEVIRGVQEAAEDYGLGVVLTKSGSRHSPGTEWLDGVIRRRPLAVVLVFSEVPPAMRETLAARSTPFVVIDPAGDPEPDVPAVGSANWAGGLAAVRHLIGLGHERIAAVSGPSDMMCSHARIDGYRAAMTAADLPIRDEWILYGDFTSEGGLTNGRKLLALQHTPTAIFAGSDLQALGVYDAARERGLRVPEDLSVVGYDDIPLAQWVSPRMTTINQPLAEMGRQAVHIAVGLAKGEVQDTPRMDLATQLVVRESTTSPRAVTSPE
ncbi:LacI family DNA-binding transcriptional regulator [Klugiella xanthotipulae]|uniref:LacI family transcriptional regulator n=1 Tax=Klugiella xanthotipulae TaxID=244735 RepID=A0A543I3U3_9MICO|nr:LacI family DNA-binding transcriptional regulator [Klugiella xanthotipulae]TQM65248.1 LacI family transcriptional regulator [Klugiella xanthotipulae]